MIETFLEHQTRLRQDQENKTKEEVQEEMESQSEYVADLDSLPKQQHNWVKRGIKVSCEGANHPYHSHFLVKR